MRIAIFADIHGNLPAFEAALAHVRRQGVDQLVLAGDIVNGGPDSPSCWQLAQSLGCPLLRGNHERYVFDYGTPSAPAIWSTERFAPIQWTYAQFSTAERQAMAALPLTLRLPDAPDLLLVHASPRKDNDGVYAYTPEAELAEKFAGVPETYIVRGHDHWCQVRLWGERTIITAGSIGCTLDESHATAQYVILERRRGRWLVDHQAVPYDVDTVVARFQSSGCLAASGPMGRLFLREVATASPHLVPFLTWYERQELQEVSLTEAVDRFLSYY
jgi:Calcineurin-like phosphoesterase superfamily domain